MISRLIVAGLVSAMLCGDFAIPSAPAAAQAIAPPANTAVTPPPTTPPTTAPSPQMRRTFRRMRHKRHHRRRRVNPNLVSGVRLTGPARGRAYGRYRRLMLMQQMMLRQQMLLNSNSL